MVDSNNDPFNSLGGSLMKDLLEDLALGDDDFLSLDQLEQDLQEMEINTTFEAPPPITSAAGLVVERQSHQQSMNSMLFDSSSASSLGAPASNPSLFAQPAFGLLPGVSNPENSKSTLDAWSLSLQNFSGSSLLQEDFLQADSARKQKQQEQQQKPKGPPPGLDSLPEYDISAPPPGMAPLRAVAPPPQMLVEQAAAQLEAQLHQQEDTKAEISAVDASPLRKPTPPVISEDETVVPSTRSAPMPPRTPEPTTTPWNKVPPAPTPFSTPQNSVGTKPVVARPRIYANPHPTAEPVPAANIPSQYMPPRDICYVVHSILKPILTQNPADASTYHLEYWMKHHPAAPLVTDTHRTAVDSAKELASRHAKATEWSKEKKVLGSTSKSVVTRPRALIAVVHPKDEEKENDDQKRSNQTRAALWKARVRCDQGYACFAQLHSATARIKLLKCFGLQNGSLDEDIFRGVLKLSKGRNLLARTLEQYPEVIPISLLPATLKVVAAEDPITDNRLCAAWARVIAGTSDETVVHQTMFLNAIEIVVERGNIVLQDTSHMMIAHALLQKAGVAAATNATFASQFAPLEAKFMELLSSL